MSDAAPPSEPVQAPEEQQGSEVMDAQENNSVPEQKEPSPERTAPVENNVGHNATPAVALAATPAASVSNAAPNSFTTQSNLPTRQYLDQTVVPILLQVSVFDFKIIEDYTRLLFIK